MSKEKIFVYGTLLKGCSNHPYFLSEAKKLGSHTTEPEFTMLHLGGFPGVVANGNTAIVGEVYEVTEQQLEGIDHLEGYNSENPQFGLYNKKQINTPWGPAWIYIYNARRDISDSQIIHSGSWNTR